MEVEGRMPCHVGKLHASEDTVWLQPVTCGGNIAHAEEQPTEENQTSDSPALTNVEKAGHASMHEALTVIDDARVAIINLSMIKMLSEKANMGMT